MAPPPDFEPVEPAASWREVRRAYRRFLTALREETDDVVAYWQAFCIACRSRKPPNHLFQILDRLPDNKDSHVLDHGCGSGTNVCFFLARGYRNAIGVDLERHASEYGPLNDFLVRTGITDSPPFVTYDGRQTELANGRFDVIYSNQVIEHLSDRDFVAYFREERRLLKPDGAILHEVPHKHMIYEGHLKTYLVHMLPKPFLIAVMRATGNDLYQIIGDGFHLRSIATVRSMVQSEFPFIQDITRERIASGPDLDDYEGNKAIRRIYQEISNWPGFTNILPSFAIWTFEARIKE